METTSTFDKTTQAYLDGSGLIVNRGGTRSGKTYGTLQLLFNIAQFSQLKRVITVLSHSFPHLELGAVRDFDNILRGEGIDPDTISTKRPYVYHIGNSIIEFISVDNLGKALGASRDILFVNEANKIKHSIYHQLMIRTTECVFIDFNPDGEFWLQEHGYDKERDTVEIVSTYLDNIENLTKKQIAELDKAHERALKEKSDGKQGYWSFWWAVYGEGRYGRLIDRMVFPNYNIVERIDRPFRHVGYGLDFGFSSDPTAVVAVYVDKDDRVLLDEVIYETGLINVRNDDLPNASIEERLIENRINQDLFIIADSAEPKSIVQLRGCGFNIRAVRKPKIADRLRDMQQYDIYVTERSRNVIHEMNNYLYPIDKNDKIVNGNPVGDDHAIDGASYFLFMRGRLWR